MSPYRRLFSIDPEWRYLNHGSFGACPIEVQEKRFELQRRMESQLVRFFVREVPPLLDGARAELGGFVGAAPDRLALVPNATTGVNSVLRSLPLQLGDELLVTDHEYNACRNVIDFVAQRSGCRVVIAKIPFPISDPDEVLQAIDAVITNRTALLLIDHITSQTGLIFPIERIVAHLAARGVDTLVDGAHAPGMVPLDLDRLGAAYYTGNCHKWMCAPKGAGFLYVREDRVDRVRPAVISHGANAPLGERTRFRHEFDWTGTDDPTAYLCLPAALKFLRETLPGGVEAIRAHNHDLALRARAVLCDALSISPPAPDSMIGSLVSLPLPDSDISGAVGAFDIDPVQEGLFQRRIEVPVMPWPAPPRRLLRISAQIYNDLTEYQHLAATLRELLDR